MAFKDYGVALGSLAAVAALSMMRARSSASRSESDDEDDERDDDASMDNVRSRLLQYTQVGKMLGKYAAEQSDDIEEVGNEATLDIVHEGVKAATRERSPLIMKMGIVPSFRMDMFTGLPRTYDEDWADSPELRFRVLYAAALQARSAYDKIARVPSRPVLAPSERWGVGEVLENVPSQALLYTYAKAMEQAASEALKDSAASRRGIEDDVNIDALEAMKWRAGLLARKHAAKMAEQASSAEMLLDPAGRERR